MPSIQIRGITNIAFPIRGTDGRVVAAINIPHIARIDGTPRPDIEQIKDIMANICMRLSTRIGYDAQRPDGEAEG
jgi:DNA-binding IclR family transcriptional regulator